MDAVEQITLVEHIRKRLGIYWPTHDGIPDASVWIYLLDQLATGMGAAFMRGEVSYVDIRYDAGSRTMSIECDGSVTTDGLCEICKGDISGLLMGYLDLGVDAYTMIAALSHRMEIATCRNGEWYAVQRRDGRVGALERLFPEVMGAGQRNIIRVSFIPSKDCYNDVDLDDVWSNESLAGLGNGLAARFPGLVVSLNGHRYHFYENGMQRMAAELLEPLGGGTLIYPKSVSRENVSLAFGAARRDDSHRRVFGRFYLNGREVKNQNVMGRIMGIAVNLLVDNGDICSSGYDFVFIVNVYCPDMHFNDEWRNAYNREGRNPNYRLASDTKYLNSKIAKCMLMAFKEYMR